MTDDRFDGITVDDPPVAADLMTALKANLHALLRDQQAAREIDLVEGLDAPIFVRLMKERRQNPLGITLYEIDGVDICNAFGDPVIHIEARWTWMLTRPYLTPVHTTPTARKALA